MPADVNIANTNPGGAMTRVEERTAGAGLESSVCFFTPAYLVVVGLFCFSGERENTLLCIQHCETDTHIVAIIRLYLVALRLVLR